MIYLHQIIQWSNTNQGFVSACLTLAYVLATIWLVLLARHQLSHATQLERSRTRPFVLFDLILDHHFVFAQITNTGQRPARDVRVSILPRLQCVLGGEGQHPPQERAIDIAFIERGVAMLAPGRTITAMAGFWARFHAAYPTLRFEGAVEYNDGAGHSYSEPFIVDLSAHEGVLYRGTKDIEDVAKGLEAIARTLDHIASGFKKPIVRTMTEEQYRAEEEAFIAQAEQALQKPIE
jgi:hypothetical protein